MKRILLFLIAIFFTANVFATGIGANDTTASCDNETLGQTSGTANIEVDWQPNTINIRWYDGDTQLNVQSNAQSCVYDDDLYLPATQPTKTGYTFKGWAVIDVPPGYTKLEYLQSNGTQWIDTNIFYSDNDVYRLVMDMQFTATNSGLQYSGIYAGAYFGLYHTKYVVGGIVNNGITNVSADTNRHVFDLNTTIGPNKNMILKIDNDTYTNIRDISQGYAGILNLPGHTDYPCYAKLHNAKLYKNGNMVFNGIPARRNSDNVLGMYDTVTGTFFTNSGSGTFIAGPAVQ